MLIRAIGVAVPAHDEEEKLPACLTALRIASGRPGMPPVRIVVIADACRDTTVPLARKAGAEVLEVTLRNAGAARGAGLDRLATSATVALPELWLATTDADSRVPPHWLERQLQWRSEGWDAVAGTVVVEDWSGHHHETALRFARQYGSPRDDHPHVHGANLGLSGTAYRQIGGFPPLALAEDHALVAALTRCGLRVARPGGPPVVTSARRDPRAADGFGALLASMEPRGAVRAEPSPPDRQLP